MKSMIVIGAFLAMASGSADAQDAGAEVTLSAADRFGFVVSSDPPVDFELLRRAIERELQVELVSPIEPHDGLLEVTFQDRTVKVRFLTRGRDPVHRTIALPRESAATIEAVALLAGNVARRQADELLASLLGPDGQATIQPAEAAPEESPPPAPIARPVDPALNLTGPTDPVPAPPSEPRDDRYSRRAVAIGIAPVLSSDFVFGTRYSHTVALHAAVGLGGEVDGLAGAGAVEIRTGRVSGAQLAGGVTVAGEVHGAQLAGGVSVAKAVHGAQGAGGVAVSAGPVEGVQGAGSVAVAAGRVRGAQLSGGINVAAQGIDGLQLTGGANIATGAVDGAQLGPVNVAGDVQGVQLGVVNIGRRVRGAQIGIVNVATDQSDASVGLVNIHGRGRTEVEVWGESNLSVMAALRHGGGTFHSLLVVGAKPVNGQRLFAGLGFGARVQLFEGGTLDLDLVALHAPRIGSDVNADMSLLNQARLTIGFDLGPVTLIAGGAYNVFVGIDDDANDLSFDTIDALSGSDTTVRQWPSLFAGARF
ncbi:MAG: hypothetical protein AAGF12_40120 [Myxococcota bacterium]